MRRIGADAFALRILPAPPTLPTVKLPDPPDNTPSGKVPRSALIIMGVMLAGMVTVAIYANVQHLKRDKIETVIVTPVATPSATP
jgi:hypothetical protein